MLRSRLILSSFFYQNVGNWYKRIHDDFTSIVKIQTLLYSRLLPSKHMQFERTFIYWDFYCEEYV